MDAEGSYSEKKLPRPRLPHSRLELCRYDKTLSPFADVLFFGWGNEDVEAGCRGAIQGQTGASLRNPSPSVPRPKSLHPRGQLDARHVGCARRDQRFSEMPQPGGVDFHPA